MDLTGTVLKERYCIIGKAGKGGSGTLFLAKDLELSTIWAVKRIPREKRNEARMLRRLTFPHIPRMIDYAESDEACYLVMEYIEGVPLDQLCKDKPPRFTDLLSYIHTILETLHYLHTLKPPVCYADLKPSNLIISKDKKLYLVDFGSAGPSTNGFCAGQCEGTPGFAAPEQYRGILTPASDIYSLGKTALALTTGKRLLLHPCLWAFLRICTRTQPEKRFRDAGAALEKLSFLQKGRRAAIAAVLVLLVLAAGIQIAGPGKHTDPERTNLSEAEDEAAGDMGSMEDEEGMAASFWKQLTRITEAYMLFGADRSKSSSDPDQEILDEEILDQAEHRLAKLLEDTSQPELRCHLLLILAAQARLSGRQDSAEVYYRQAIEAEPEDLKAYCLFGRFLIQAGLRARSRLLWKEAVSRFGKDALSGPAAFRESLIWTKELGLLCE